MRYNITLKGKYYDYTQVQQLNGKMSEENDMDKNAKGGFPVKINRPLINRNSLE